MGLTQVLGKSAEDFACHYLKRQGLTLLNRNFLCRHGELDLVMKSNQYQLIFIEVRLRNQPGRISGADSVDYYKQQKLIRAAQYYLQQQKYSDNQSCRFDVLDLYRQSGIFKARWIQNAFEIG